MVQWRSIDQKKNEVREELFEVMEEEVLGKCQVEGTKKDA